MNRIYKYLLSVIILLTAIVGANAQKHYVWCPDDVEVKPRTGMAEGVEVGLVIFDGRVVSEKGKIECSGEEIADAIRELLGKAYPSVHFNVLDESAYYKKPPADQVTVKLGLSAYHAGFGVDVSTGVGMVGGSFAAMAFPKGGWNSATAIYVQFENGTTSSDKDISNVASRPNMLGYKSARNGLQESYEKSIQQLLFFLDKELADLQ